MPALVSRAGFRVVPAAALLFVLCAVAPALSKVPGDRAAPSNGADDSERLRHPWCDPKYETLPGEVCHYSPPGKAPRVLVIFLHGVIQWNTTWQWTQQRAAARFAKTNHFSALMPRGRRGVGHSEQNSAVTWPTATPEQKSVEQQVIDEWLAAKLLLEERNGRPFEQTFIFGYSAGAYCASSLALRGRLDVDGYAVFAGGSTPKHFRRQLPKRRAPIFVSYGIKDKAWRDPAGLAWSLREVGWPHRLDVRAQIGHTMTDSQVKNAFKFLSGR